MCGIAGVYLKNPDFVKQHEGLETFVNALYLGIEPLRPLVDEQYLEERRSARLAGGAETVDEQRERIVLVIERAEP